jgi:hypothetical protein
MRERGMRGFSDRGRLARTLRRGNAGETPAVHDW